MTDIDWNSPFKPEDFGATFADDEILSTPLPPWRLEQVARKANRRFRELLEQAPRVYKYGPYGWHSEESNVETVNDIPPTHQASLIEIEEIT